MRIIRNNLRKYNIELYRVRGRLLAYCDANGHFLWKFASSLVRRVDPNVLRHLAEYQDQNVKIRILAKLNANDGASLVGHLAGTTYPRRLFRCLKRLTGLKLIKPSKPRYAYSLTKQGKTIAELIDAHAGAFLMIKKFSPLLERVLHHVARIALIWRNVGLEPHFAQYLVSDQTTDPSLLKELADGLFRLSRKSLLMIIQESKEIESLYSYLSENGTLEMLKNYHEPLNREMRLLYEYTRNFSKSEIDSLKDVLELSHTLAQDTVDSAQRCEKLLEEFLYPESYDFLFHQRF